MRVERIPVTSSRSSLLSCCTSSAVSSFGEGLYQALVCVVSYYPPCQLGLNSSANYLQFCTSTEALPVGRGGRNLPEPVRALAEDITSTLTKSVLWSGSLFTLLLYLSMGPQIGYTGSSEILPGT
jgi:hypothetical protein